MTLDEMDEMEAYEMREMISYRLTSSDILDELEIIFNEREMQRAYEIIAAKWDIDLFEDED